MDHRRRSCSPPSMLGFRRLAKRPVVNEGLAGERVTPQSPFQTRLEVRPNMLRSRSIPFRDQPPQGRGGGIEDQLRVDNLARGEGETRAAAYQRNKVGQERKAGQGWAVRRFIDTQQPGFE